MSVYSFNEKLEKSFIFSETFVNKFVAANQNIERFRCPDGYYFRCQILSNNLIVPNPIPFNANPISYKLKRSRGGQSVFKSNYEASPYSNYFTMLPNDIITITTIGATSTLNGNFAMLVLSYKRFI